MRANAIAAVLGGAIAIAIALVCAPTDRPRSEPDVEQSGRFELREYGGRARIMTLRDTRTGACWLLTGVGSYSGGPAPAPNEVCE